MIQKLKHMYQVEPEVLSSRSFCKFHRKESVLESLFNKVAGLKACNSIKKRFQHRCFPVKFPKFLRTHFFAKQLQWLLLRFNLFSKECGTRIGATVSNKYQIQLKKSIYSRENPEVATVGVL